MRTGRSALVTLLMVVPACVSPRTSSGDGRDPVGVDRSAFESPYSELVAFDVEGKLVTDTSESAAVRTRIQAQLMYSVGVLNVDRSLGRFERLELSAIQTTPREGTGSFDVTYRAHLPVAWGSSARPDTYTLTLPARVETWDQERFAARYGTSCVDPNVGAVGPGQMFLHYQPRRAGCVLDPSDVVALQATVSPSSDNTSGKYPEYHRVWEDGALDVVAVFSRQSYDATASPDDYGARAYEAFVTSVDDYLRDRQPDATKRFTSPPHPTLAMRAAALADGREIHVHAALVSAQLRNEGPAFDAWYDARTPEADVILYSGHADLGGNVRTLMGKGAFVPGKYALWVVNGCDTFAYVDGTLAARRALLNPDDPGGTKYLDTVSTVMGGYFTTGASTAMTFVDAMVTARDVVPAPRTYRALLAGIDPQQVTVVTGEEDNAFEPSMFAPRSPASTPSASPEDVGGGAPATGDGASTGGASAGDASSRSGASSCAAARASRPGAGGGALAFVVALALASVRRSFRARARGSR